MLGILLTFPFHILLRSIFLLVTLSYQWVSQTSNGLFCGIFKYSTPGVSVVCYGEVDLDWSVVFRNICATKQEYVHVLRAIPARGYQRVLKVYVYVLSEASMLITWIGLIFTLQGHPSERRGVFPHIWTWQLQTVAVKTVTPGGEY